MSIKRWYNKGNMGEDQIYGDWVRYEDVAPFLESQTTVVQQLQAKIAALANEIECRTRDQVSISPSMVVERLRQLSAV